MDWISVPNFKLDFAVARNATDAQAQMAIEAAEDELAELVGQAVITDTLSASPADSVRAAKIVRAHKFFAASIQCVNVRNVKTEQDAGSPAMTGQTIQNSYWTPAEIEKMRENWRQMGLKAIGPYLLTDAPDDDYDFESEFATGVLSSTPNCGTDYCS